MKLKDASRFKQLFLSFASRKETRNKNKINALISVQQKYDPVLDIHVREDWSYYKESGNSHYEPDETRSYRV